MAGELVHRRIAADGVVLHTVHAGHGPCVLLLHGFPEDWRTWKHQIAALAAAGFSVVAPDLRGYNESDRPTHAGAYHVRHLVADVAALIRASGHQRVHLVGHDWGGMLAWTVAGQHPELIDRLVILNAPHMQNYRREAQRFAPQWFKAWYVAFFQIRGLSESALSAMNFSIVRRMLRRAPSAGAYSEDDINGYVESLSKPGALTAALRWYRDNANADAMRLMRSARTAAPTLVIWGDRDPALSSGLLDGLDAIAPLVRIHHINWASHWVHNEAPAEVNRVLIEFLSAPSDGEPAAATSADRSTR